VRNLHREAQALIEQAVVQQAEKLGIPHTLARQCAGRRRHPRPRGIRPCGRRGGGDLPTRAER
jgi:hypothetical protein